MIQNQVILEFYNKEQVELTKQITEYRRINASLKKKIQARDKKIAYLFSCIQPTTKSLAQSTLDSSVIRKNRSEIDTHLYSKKEACLTEPKNKQKQNHMNHNHSIFKQKTIQANESSVRLNFRLPALQRKNIFAEDPEAGDSRPKIVKVAIQKLIPLKPEDVKKKFQNKFK